MPKWKFGIDNEKLIELVLSGKKRATTGIFNPKNCARADRLSCITHDDGSVACVVKTISVHVIPFSEVTWDLAGLEGECEKLNERRAEHLKFFSSVKKDLCPDSLVEFEVFEGVRKL